MQRAPLFAVGLLSAVALVACGAHVVVDTTSSGQGGQGAGGQGTAGNVGTGMGGSFDTSVTAAVGSSGAGLPVCATSGCSADSTGACACKGMCSDGYVAAADCHGGGQPCTCSLSGPNSSSVASYSPGAEANPCDIVMGCCAQFF